MTEKIQTYYQRIDQCCLADRGRIINKVRKLKERVKSNQPTDKLCSEVEALIAESEQRAQTRQASYANLSYPDLPVSERRDELKQAITDHQVIVVAGETGSGKTTQLPKMCVELGLADKGMIAHTQPRRLAARTVANRISEELQTPLGEQVGYQVRFHDQVSERTLIKLMTDGILLAETQNDPLLRKYQVIIIDEAHERSLNIDFLLGYIKRILPKRPDLKLIITSATIDLERFSEHFGGAPIIQVSGRTYPVDIQYRPLLNDAGEDQTQYQGIQTTVEEIIQLDKTTNKNGPRDILVFLSGEREIREAADQLRKAEFRDTEIMPLYARLSTTEQNKIFHGRRAAGRRVVLATNVAETSITVPNIRYVIDTGIARISRYSYRSKVQRLPLEPVSQASANQRAGRCGRIAAGVCFRLYSQEDFQQRPEFTDAEIQRTNLAAVILQMLHLRLGDIAEFPFVDRPDRRFINDGFKLLEELGAVTSKRTLTAIGKQLSRLPVDPRIGRMLVEANTQGAVKEVAIIASALSVQDPRERPADKQQAADQKHKEYADEASDFLTLVNLWNLYEEQRQSLSQNQLRKFCQKHFLSYMRMREWRDIHRQLHISCNQLGIKERAEEADYKAVHVSLLAGLLSHMGTKNEGKEFLGARNRKFFIFPSSSLYKKPPKWLMAAELVETSKLYARTLARIEPEWAESLGKHLVKKSYLEPSWFKKRAQVMAYEQVTLYGLTIVAKRRVDYGRIDPAAAHEIFIRSALVEGEFQTRGAFFSHNQNLLQNVELLEAKSRRRDLLVDEETLYVFYAGKMAELNGEHIVNGKGFETWRKKIEADQPKALFLTEEDILQRSAQHVSRYDYPDEFIWQGAKLKLEYTFEPGSKSDGVSIHVPLPLLKQLPIKRLQWLVPGMLKEKCEVMIRALPKQTRKQYVPVPDYAQASVEAMEFGSGDLAEALAHQLLRMSGLRMDADLFKHLKLDDHYQMNIKLLDAAGKLIDQGRDWLALCQTYGAQSDQEIKSTESDEWGEQNLTAWSFKELETKIQLKQAGGIHIDAWPMLLDKGESVDLTVAMTESHAEHASRRGIARLALLAMKTEAHQLRNRLPKLNESLLFTGKLFTKKKLENDILIQSTIQAMGLDESLPRTKDEYDQRLKIAKLQLKKYAEEVAHFVHVTHYQYHQISKQLNKIVRLDWIIVLNDIKAQLAWLVNGDYLNAYSWHRLSEYPRYLKAIELRLEKFAQELPRQRLLSEQIQAFQTQYQARHDQLRKLQEYNSELESFRWSLEEYRVSVFAQQLKTKETVSEKRIKAKWTALTG